jgi:xylulokinase
MAWFDRRTEADGKHVEETIGGERLFRITGYPPDSTLSLCKILWHRREEPETFAKTRLILPISPWIAFRLSGVPAVDFSLASRTLCLDARSRTWSTELLEAVGLDSTLFPPILPSGTSLGPIRPELIEATGLPGQPVVAVGAQDHICGAFAAGVTKPGVFLDSLGTAEALLATAEHPPLTLAQRELGYAQTTVGIDSVFCFVGSGLNRSGGAVEWACNAIGQGAPRDELIRAAQTVPAGSGGVCFLPHLAYSSAPSPDTASRGAFVGLTDMTDRASLFRAVLEGVAMEARLISDALFSLPGVGAPMDIRVIGGGTKNSLLLEIKASVFGRALTVFDEAEVTAVGAALLGGFGAGLWPDFDAALAELDLRTYRVLPRPEWKARYASLFEEAYRGLNEALRPVNHNLSGIPGGSF